MATGEPDFFNITIESGNVATIGVHFHKALRKEFDSTFIESKCMSEMARVCYRRGGGDVNIFLDQAQRRHRIPSQSQYTWYEGHDKGFDTPDSHEMNPHILPTELLPEFHCFPPWLGIRGIDGKVVTICPFPIYS